MRFLARGGMGEVYEVEDTAFGGRLALKTVRPEVASDLAGLGRLKREFQLARRVTHPHVCRLFDLVTHAGPDGERVGLTMELLHGESLADRLEREGRLPAADASVILRQIAEALAAAHAASVIHRDLKPGNVSLEAAAGPGAPVRAVVTDFGLARPTATRHEPDPQPLTEAHVVMGTTAYMAPEQARGDPLTPACDVWAFGVVAYETLTGRRPFEGDTPLSIVVRAARERPTRPSRLVPTLDPHWDEVILRCLEFEPERRPHDGAALIGLLDRPRSLADRPTAAHSSAPRRRLTARLGIWPAAAILLATLAVVAGLALRGGLPPVRSRPTPAPSALQLTTWPGLEVDPSFSPAGDTLAFAANRSGRFEIYLKRLAPGSRELPLTTAGDQCFQPSWSPDGRTIAYFSAARRGIWLVPASGGEPHRLTEFGSHPAWSPDGRQLVFQTDPTAELSANAAHALPPSTLWLVPAGGGEPRPITRAGEPAGGHGAPTWTPDGRRIIFTASDRRWSSIWSIAVDGSNLVQVVDSPRAAFDPTVSPDGRRLYYAAVSEGESYGVWALPFDSRTGAARGAAVPLATLGSASARQFDVSPDGRQLAHSALETTSNLWALPVDPAGGRPLGTARPITSGSGRNSRPAFSPDGTVLAFERWWVGSNQDLWWMAADGSGLRQLTSDAGREMVPAWMPSADELAFLSDRDGLGLFALDLASGEQRLLVDLGQRIDGVRVSPDGRRMAFHSAGSDGVLNVWVADLALADPRQLTFDHELAAFPCWSPDGKRIAYEVRRGDSDTIWTVPAEGGTPVQLTDERGRDWPWSWSPDGDRIVFASLRDGAWNLRWVSVSTRQELALTDWDEPNGYLRYPAWSPRGDLIVFEHAETTGDLWLLEGMR